MSPYSDHSALSKLFDLVIRHLLPLANDDRVQPSVVRTRAGRDIQVRNGLVQIVQHLRMPFEKILHHHLRQLQAHGDGVTIVVVLDVHFHNGGDQKDCVLADVLNDRRILYCQTIGQLHEHFRRSGFR